MEHALIAQLRRRSLNRNILLGIGDDAAVLPPSDAPSLWTTDMLTEGVDFLLTETDPRRIGRKALAANLSDIAAMGGTPTAFLVSLALPRIPGPQVPALYKQVPALCKQVPALCKQVPTPLKLAELLHEGMFPLEKQYGVVLAGGDTNCWDGGLVVSITVLGKAGKGGVWKRSGGKPGDVLLSTGPFGGSILERQFSFTPRVFEAMSLNEHHEIHAAMDVSDGLSLDVFRLATESGLGATLFADDIPITDDARKLSEKTGRTPLEHALSDGEDFELILAVDPNEAEILLTSQPLNERFGTTLYRIGELTGEKGLRLRDKTGIFPLEPKGFEH